jgi:hypothetical protein
MPRAGGVLPALGVLAFALAGASCGGAGGVVSCTLSEMAGASGTIKLCEEVSASERAQLQQTCVLSPDASASGIDASTDFVDGPCSHDGAAGGCRITSQGVTVTDWWYSTGTATTPTMADIQKLCGPIGVFVAP